MITYSENNNDCYLIIMGIINDVVQYPCFYDLKWTKNVQVFYFKLWLTSFIKNRNNLTVIRCTFQHRKKKVIVAKRWTITVGNKDSVHSIGTKKTRTEAAPWKRVKTDTKSCVTHLFHGIFLCCCRFEKVSITSSLLRRKNLQFPMRIEMVIR